MSLRRMVPFILINILVSAAVVLLILNWWERQQVDNVANAAATVQVTLPPLTGNEGSVAALGETVVPEPTDPSAVVDGQTRYAVQVGDTLGSISAQFDISMADIIDANNIDNPDLLSVGQELLIPSAGAIAPNAPESEPVTNELPAESEDATPVPAPTEPLPAGVVIVEITEVAGPGVLADEVISVANFGDSPSCTARLAAG